MEDTVSDQTANTVRLPWNVGEQLLHVTVDAGQLARAKELLRRFPATRNATARRLVEEFPQIMVRFDPPHPGGAPLDDLDRGIILEILTDTDWAGPVARP